MDHRGARMQEERHVERLLQLSKQESCCLGPRWDWWKRWEVVRLGMNILGSAALAIKEVII